MPFLRLTRDRRGTENTFLLHADRPGDRPTLLYWYRTAPGIILGRRPLDEDAIRTIEDQHPEIDFDWPAILALSEVMTPEDEAPPARSVRRGRPPRREPPSRASTDAYTPRTQRPAEEAVAVDDIAPELQPFDESPTTHGLLEELRGPRNRDAASRPARRESWRGFMNRAWTTPRRPNGPNVPSRSIRIPGSRPMPCSTACVTPTGVSKRCARLCWPRADGGPFAAAWSAIEAPR